MLVLPGNEDNPGGRDEAKAIQRRTDHRDTEAARGRGRGVEDDIQGFNDSTLLNVHDIGTILPTSGSRLGGPLTGLDSPTLRGVWGAAPYLHDGSAATLTDAVNAHNGVSLTSGEVTQLVAYLNEMDGREPAANTPPTVTDPGDQSSNYGDPVLIFLTANDNDGDPFIFSASGLPVGLSIDPASGVIFGTAAIAGNYSVAVTATDINGLFGSVSFSWNVDPAEIIVAQFDAGVEGFVYKDDTFRGTSEPDYASGSWNSSGGFIGGGLQVTLGGINNVDILGMSGGWQVQFNLSSQTPVNLSFRYNLIQAGGFEIEEYSQALVTFNGTLLGQAGPDYLAQITGDGNAGDPQSTGWQLFSVDLGVLATGTHTVVIGAYNNQKTFNDETTEVFVDDVLITSESVTNFPPTLLNPGNQSNGEADVVNLAISANDPEGDPMTFSAIGLPGGLSIDVGSGVISGALTYDSSGMHNVTVSVSDSNGIDNAMFVWTVTNVDPPTTTSSTSTTTTSSTTTTTTSTTSTSTSTTTTSSTTTSTSTTSSTTTSSTSTSTTTSSTTSSSTTTTTMSSTTTTSTSTTTTSSTSTTTTTSSTTSSTTTTTTSTTSTTTSTTSTTSSSTSSSTTSSTTTTSTSSSSTSTSSTTTTSTTSTTSTTFAPPVIINIDSNVTLWTVYAPTGTITPMYSTNLGMSPIDWYPVSSFANSFVNGTNVIEFDPPDTNAAAVFFELSQVLVDTEIRSINTMGYHKQTLAPGDLCLVSPTLDNQNGNTLEDLLGDQLPIGSAVFRWNGLGYDTPSVRTTLFGWTPNYEVLRGQTILVQISSSVTNAVTFAFTGEVPEARNGGGTTTVAITGLDATAYPYPVNIEFAQTRAAVAAPLNSAVFFWNKFSQRYDPATMKTWLVGWGATESRLVPIGEACFMQTPFPISVDEVQTYDLGD